MLQLWLTTLISLVVAVQGLHFDIAASTDPEQVCIRDFVTEGQLVVVDIHSDGSVGDGQKLNLFVRDSVGNEYRRKRDFQATFVLRLLLHPPRHSTFVLKIRLSIVAVL